MLSLLETEFPTTADLIRARWAPLLLRPILGSPEQLIIGVAAVSEAGFHLEKANSFSRLSCLFSDDAEFVILAAEAALNGLEADLAERGLGAIADYRPIFSGVVIGEIAEAEGCSLQAIASSWMSALSSIYTNSADALALVEDLSGNAEVVPSDLPRVRDRLPTLVWDYVKNKRPGLADFFSDEIREQNVRRRAQASAVFIDFAGAKLVANFGTLLLNQHGASVDRIKRRLWDLRVDQDNDAKGMLSPREHEMIVQFPRKNDPQVSERQFDRISEALNALERQAHQQQIRFRSLNTVDEIGEHLLAKEAA